MTFLNGMFYPLSPSYAQTDRGCLWETKGARACDFCSEALLAALW